MASFQGSKINPSKFHKSQIGFYIFLVLPSIFMLLPILYIFMTAFKPLEELFAFPPRFIVVRPTLDSLRYLFMSDAVGFPKMRYIFNSLLVTIAVLALSIIISSMAGYALSKKNFTGKKLLFEINTLALMFVPLSVMIPRFIIISNLGITDTYLGHIMPLIAMPVGLFLLKQFIDQIPDSLIEAAKIDGANDFNIYFNLILPIITPALATVAILAFQAVWNSDETSKYYVNVKSLQTFAFYVTTLTTTGNTVQGQGMAAAAALIMFLPNLILFIFMQNKVMNTMAHSGLK